MYQRVPISAAADQLSELAGQVEREHHRVLVTRDGKPSFVMMNPDDLDSLEETLDILSDEELAASLRLSIEQANRGELIPLRHHI